MFQSFLQSTNNIFYTLSVCCVVIFIFWFIFFVLYLKKRKSLQKLELLHLENNIWRDLKEKELEEQKERVSQLTGEKLDLIKENERLKSDMSAQEKYVKEQLDFLKNNKEELALKFKDISNEIIKAQNLTFSENQKNTLDLLLKPFQTQLTEFKKKIEDTHDDNVKFDGQIKHLFVQ